MTTTCNSWMLNNFSFVRAVDLVTATIVVWTLPTVISHFFQKCGGVFCSQWNQCRISAEPVSKLLGGLTRGFHMLLCCPQLQSWGNSNGTAQCNEHIPRMLSTTLQPCMGQSKDALLDYFHSGLFKLFQYVGRTSLSIHSVLSDSKNRYSEIQVLTD